MRPFARMTFGWLGKWVGGWEVLDLAPRDFQFWGAAKRLGLKPIKSNAINDIEMERAR